MPSVGELCNLLVAYQRSSGSVEGNIALTALSMKVQGRGKDVMKAGGGEENIANIKIHIFFFYFLVAIVIDEIQT